MSDRKLMQQALDFLDALGRNHWGDRPALVTALKERLAQPEQEPVAWMVYTQDGQSVYVTDNPTDIQDGQRALPLYTTPPQRKPLSDEELFKIWLSVPAETEDRYAFARAVEAAHGIKE